MISQATSSENQLIPTSIMISQSTSSENQLIPSVENRQISSEADELEALINIRHQLICKIDENNKALRIVFLRMNLTGTGSRYG